MAPTLTYTAHAFKSGQKFLFTVLKAKDLPDEDNLFNKSDAYFRIKVPGNATRKTPTISGSSNPVWTKENGFIFSGGAGDVVELVCMDWDPMGDDDDMVKANIELTDAILEGEQQTTELQLHDDDDSEDDEGEVEKAEVGDVSSQLRRRRVRNAATNAFQYEALRAHNKYRARHGACPLKLGKNASKIAQKHAEYLVGSKGSQLIHSGTKGYGENLTGAPNAWAQGEKASGNYAVDGWYKEIYDYKKHSFTQDSGKATGHYSQLVWKGSKWLGIGVAETSPGQNRVVVASYYPAGNVTGQFPQNVGNRR